MSHAARRADREPYTMHWKYVSKILDRSRLELEEMYQNEYGPTCMLFEQELWYDSQSVFVFQSQMRHFKDM